MLAHAAHEKEGDNIGKDDCDDPTGRCPTDIFGYQRLLVDHVGKRRRRRSGATLCGGEDFTEDAEQEDRLNKDYNRNGTGHVWQRDKTEPA